MASAPINERIPVIQTSAWRLAGSLDDAFSRAEPRRDRTMTKVECFFLALVEYRFKIIASYKQSVCF
jgi:hypothetical protein